MSGKVAGIYFSAVILVKLKQPEIFNKVRKGFVNEKIFNVKVQGYFA